MQASGQRIGAQTTPRLGDARLQGILVAIRAWNSGKSNPLSSVQLAMREQEIDHDLIGGDGDD